MFYADRTRFIVLIFSKHSSAPDVLYSPPCSMAKCSTTPSRTTIAYRRLRTPKPCSIKSKSTPIDLAIVADPSANIITFARLAPALSPHAFMTNASFTLTHITASAPFARISSAYLMYPGKCFVEHVGVNAPGTAKSTHVRPRVSSPSVCVCNAPSSSKYLSATSVGSRSPCVIAGRSEPNMRDASPRLVVVARYDARARDAKDTAPCLAAAALAKAFGCVLHADVDVAAHADVVGITIRVLIVLVVVAIMNARTRT
jgi:hypothetical protein